MQPNPMNDLMRRAGNRSRALPNIGQTPLSNTPAAKVTEAVGATPTGSAQPAQPTPPPQPQGAPPVTPQTGGISPMMAPQVQPSTFTLHPPGTPADPNQYTYEPQPDGAWRVYPPGVQAPPHTVSASLPRAASTADYRRMRQAFQTMQQTPQ